jgi:NAD-dependent deacetylase
MKEKIDAAAPNAAHKAIAEYGIPVVTMNIDGLHRRAGSKQLIEIHGNMETVFCMNCGEEYDFGYTRESLHCKDCNGLLKPNVVLYGEMIPKYHEAMNLIGSADELLVVGTSFYTSTSTDLVGRARWDGVRVKVINSNAEIEVPEYLRKVLG